jgi:hypothetical protein
MEVYDDDMYLQIEIKLELYKFSTETNPTCKLVKCVNEGRNKNAHSS